MTFMTWNIHFLTSFLILLSWNSGSDLQVILWVELTWQVRSCCSMLSCMVGVPAAPAASRLLCAFCSHSSSWLTLSRHTWRTPSWGRGPGWDPADRGSCGAWDTNTTHPAEALCSRVAGRGAELNCTAAWSNSTWTGCCSNIDLNRLFHFQSLSPACLSFFRFPSLSVSHSLSAPPTCGRNHFLERWQGSSDSHPLSQQRERTTEKERRPQAAGEEPSELRGQ